LLIKVRFEKKGMQGKGPTKRTGHRASTNGTNWRGGPDESKNGGAVTGKTLLGPEKEKWGKRRSKTKEK